VRRNAVSNSHRVPGCAFEMLHPAEVLTNISQTLLTRVAKALYWPALMMKPGCEGSTLLVLSGLFFMWWIVHATARLTRTHTKPAETAATVNDGRRRHRAATVRRRRARTTTYPTAARAAGKDGRRRRRTRTGRLRLVEIFPKPAATGGRRLAGDRNNAAAIGAADKDGRLCRRSPTGGRRLVASLIKPAAAMYGTRLTGHRRSVA